jgi:NitT/TauT family transport system substrate-binding protein
MFIPRLLVLTVAAALASLPAAAEDTRVAIGLTDWTGFGPLTLAREAGLFGRHGLDVSIRKMAHDDRHTALATGEIQCAATTVETWIVWNARGAVTTQIFQVDRSVGADGMVVKPAIARIADLKGKTVAASAPGTSPHFMLAWLLRKNGLSLKDVNLVRLEPAAATEAMLAGAANLDAAMTYEPYLSAVRTRPGAGRIIATTVEYPMVMDTFGCTSAFLAENPRAAQALTDAYFDAVDLIAREPKKSFAIMGAAYQQTADEFEASQKFLRWPDRAASREFFAGEHARFSREAADLLLEAGVIEHAPDLSKLADTRFLQ